MKPKLIELLGLAPDATDDQVLKIVQNLKGQHEKANAAAGHEERLQSLMHATNMSRLAAEECLLHQAEGEKQKQIAEQRAAAEEEAVLARGLRREAARRRYAAAHPELVQ